MEANTSGTLSGMDLPIPSGDGATAAAAAGTLPRPWWREAIALLPELGRLLRSLSGDPRVPWHAKAIAAGAAVYVASPIDLVPDLLPGVGGIDDLVVVLFAVRRLVAAAGYDVVREHWAGTDAGVCRLMVIYGVAP
jgi:uncharacterized membrane protein YkvA (DUF1232 family)